MGNLKLPPPPSSLSLRSLTVSRKHQRRPASSLKFLMDNRKHPRLPVSSLKFLMDSRKLQRLPVSSLKFLTDSRKLQRLPVSSPRSLMDSRKLQRLPVSSPRSLMDNLKLPNQLPLVLSLRSLMDSPKHRRPHWLASLPRLQQPQTRLSPQVPPLSAPSLVPPTPTRGGQSLLVQPLLLPVLLSYKSISEETWSTFAMLS